MKKHLSLIIIFGIVSQNVNAASTASTTANATCTVIANITIAKTADLLFGVSSQNDLAKTILNTAPEAASFNITGQPNQAFTITIPTTAINMVNGANTISVSTFTSNPTATSTLSATGSSILKVGATRAALTATQATGVYTGAFTVTVNY